MFTSNFHIEIEVALKENVYGLYIKAEVLKIRILRINR